MKKKVLTMFWLFLLSLPFLVTSVQAGQFSFRPFRKNSSGESDSQSSSSSQRKILSAWRQMRPWRNADSQQDSGTQENSPRWINFFPLSDNEASLQLIRDQITAVFDKLREEGFDLPSDMNQKLDDFFATALDYLMKDERQIALPLSALNNLLAKGPDYNLSWDYDPGTRVMNFVADRILNHERAITSVKLDGIVDLNGPWYLDFLVENAKSEKENGNGEDKGYFQKVFSRWDVALNSSTADTSGKTAADSSQDHQADPFWRISRNSNFILKGEMCQDGLISLYLHPSQVVNLTLEDTAAYATITGIEVTHQAGSRTGKMYMDILDKSVSGAEDKLLHHWEWPLQ
ncbi:MAG: hypothetical protein AB1611_06165 [bacterium]